MFSPARLYHNPANEFVATFVGMENIFSGTVTRAGNGLFSVSVADQTVEIIGEGVS
jgi:tungstate transport system ATP-binding protein